MNKIARKLVLSVLTVVLTVAALGTTTFAWFTLTNTAVVQPFEAQIVADTGIEIALGEPVGGDLFTLDWVTTLTTERIDAYIATTYVDAFKFNHVTTANGVDFFTLGVGELTGVASGYLELPVHFRSNSAVSIDWTSVTLTSISAPWTADVAFTAANGTAYTAGSIFNVDAADSMRISIQQIFGVGSYVVAYENPAAGNNLVLGTGGDFTDLVALDDDNFGAAGSYNYYYEKQNELPFGSGAVSTVSTVTSVANVRVLDMSPGSAATAGAANYGKIMIRVWLEGYDQNAYNSILARNISASFQFFGV